MGGVAVELPLPPQGDGSCDSSGYSNRPRMRSTTLALDVPDGARAKAFTPKQGQYLAYINLYTRLHRRPPAETDIQEYFRVTPPTVHQMIVTLERASLIRKQPRAALLVDPKHLPELI
jgi:hypothetical protein